MRIYFIRTFFLIFFVAIVTRLFYWQVIKSEELTVYAENQYEQNTTIQAVRGDILYSDNSVLVSSKPTFLLYGLPKQLNDTQKEALSKKLADVLWDNKYSLLPKDDTKDTSDKTPEEQKRKLQSDIREKLSQDLYWVILDRELDYDVKAKIEMLNLDGIGFEQSMERFYPEGSAAAHVVGFVGSGNKGESIGYFGLEGYFDGELKGIPGKLRHEKDALGLPIFTGNFDATAAKNGNTLILNIDRAVQYIVEQNLKKGIVKFGAKAASAIVMDPNTGAIYAMASYPNYDPGDYTNYPKEFFKNPTVADQYEPGSTFKVLVMAAAINEHLVKPDTECDICSGPVQVGGFSIKTWNNQYFPNISMTDVIIHSDNTGMVFIAKKMGIDKFYSYLENFGFGKPTNIDLQDESAPTLRDKSEWRDIDLATASFGQGIAVTPVQMIQAVSVIANGGNLVEPRIVRAIKDDSGTHELTPKVVKRVVSNEAADVVKEMMVKAVDEGEAKAFKPKGYQIAGKTGTAQIPVAGHYDPNKTIASFVGFAPADKPKFIMLVRYDQPTSSIYGAETAAPTFFDITKELYAYFKIPVSE